MVAFPSLHMASISWITVELRGDVSHLRQNNQEPTNHRTLLPDPAIIRFCIRGVNRKEDGTDVFREAKEAILLTSTPEKCCLERTKTQFFCDE